MLVKKCIRSTTYVLTKEVASYTIIGAERVESEGRGAKSEPSVIGKLHPMVLRMKGSMGLPTRPFM